MNLEEELARLNVRHRPMTPELTLEILDLVIDHHIRTEAAVAAAINDLNQIIDRQQQHINMLEKRFNRLEGIHGA